MTDSQRDVSGGYEPVTTTIDTKGPHVLGCDHESLQKAIQWAYDTLDTKGYFSEPLEDMEFFHLRSVLMHFLQEPFENTIRNFGPLAFSNNDKYRKLLREQLQQQESIFGGASITGPNDGAPTDMFSPRECFGIDNLVRLGDSCVFARGFHGIERFEGTNLSKLGKQAYSKSCEALDDLCNIRVGTDTDDERKHERLKETIRNQRGFFESCLKHFDAYVGVLWTVADILSNPDSRSDLDTELETQSFQVPSVVRQTEEYETGHPVKVDSAMQANATQHISQDSTLEDYLGMLQRQLLLQGITMGEFEKRLNSKVVGQEGPVRAMADSIVMMAMGVKNPRKPISLFTIGKTGHGKNKLFEATADLIREMTGFKVAYREIQMSSYQSEGSANQLFGAPKGYVGYDDEGIFQVFYGEAQKTPFSILIMDEIEKASPSVIQSLLPLLDKGYVYDTNDQCLTFSGTFIGFTSNIGYSDLRGKGNHAMGFSADHDKQERDAQWAFVEDSIYKNFSPEFLNRVQIVRFNDLSMDNIKDIFQLEFDDIASRYAQHYGVDVRCTERARDYVLDRCDVDRYGAREIGNTLEHEVNVPLAHSLHKNMTYDEEGRTEMLSYLQHIKENGGVHDKQKIYQHVMEKMAPDTRYSSIIVDAGQDGIDVTPR